MSKLPNNIDLLLSISSCDIDEFWDNAFLDAVNGTDPFSPTPNLVTISSVDDKFVDVPRKYNHSCT